MPIFSIFKCWKVKLIYRFQCFFFNFWQKKTEKNENLDDYGPQPNGNNFSFKPRQAPPPINVNPMMGTMQQRPQRFHSNNQMHSGNQMSQMHRPPPPLPPLPAYGKKNVNWRAKQWMSLSTTYEIRFKEFNDRISDNFLSEEKLL